MKIFSKHGFYDQLPYGTHMAPIWDPYGSHMGPIWELNHFLALSPEVYWKHKNIYEWFQIIKSFLLDSDAYKTNNASHKNKKIIYQIAIIPIRSICTSPIWEQQKIGKATPNSIVGSPKFYFFL